jgi:hypothetical protein
MKTSLFAMTLAAALAATASADRAEDDLQVVRKAVASSSEVAQARPPAEEPPAQTKPAPRKGEPRWLRVRIIEKAGKHARVSINLPIGVARALGGDCPVAPTRECGKDRCPTLGEILRALDAGQSLVEIEDDEATVRVWVE